MKTRNEIECEKEDMGLCSTENCVQKSTKTLTVEMDEKENLQLKFCTDCAITYNRLLADRLGGNSATLNLSNNKIAATTDDLRKVLEIMDKSIL